MTTTRFCLVRHGETDWNVQARIQGHLDIALNSLGLWQATQLGLALQHETLSCVYSSDLKRAHETAHLLASNHHTPLNHRVEAGLRERHFGDFEGLTWVELEELHPAQAQAWRSRDPEWSPPSGESLNQFKARIQRCVEDLAARHLNEHIAIVTHGGVLDVLYRWSTGQESQAPRTWALGNAHINRLLWSSEGLHLVGWGDKAHLELEGVDGGAGPPLGQDYPVAN